MPTKNLMNFLTAPARVASKLDWTATSKKSSVLAVDIGRHQIGMAVAPHPSTGDAILALKPLELQRKTTHHNRRVLTESCVQKLATIVKDHSVCALLVTWPVQTEGRCGKPCGQVLHTLDNLLEYSSSEKTTTTKTTATTEIMTHSRPVCLWDDRHIQFRASDEWGRDPHYGECTASPQKKIHKASLEQYEHHDCSSTVAAKVWLDFCQAHWPDMTEEMSTTIEEYKQKDSLVEEVTATTTTTTPSVVASQAVDDLKAAKPASSEQKPPTPPKQSSSRKFDKTDYKNRIIRIVVDNNHTDVEKEEDEEGYDDLKLAAM